MITLLGPRPFSYGPYVELFSSRTTPAFDELGAARTLAQMIADAVLQRERAARLVQFAIRGSAPLTLSETIDSLSSNWSAHGSTSSKADALRRVAQRAVADRLLLLAADKEASPDVRALVELKIDALRRRARSLALNGATRNGLTGWRLPAISLAGSRGKSYLRQLRHFVLRRAIRSG